MWNEMGNDTVHDAGNNTGNNTLILASIMNVLLFGVGVYFASYDLVDYEYWLWPFIIRDGILMGLPIITLVVLCRIRNQKRITNIKRVLYYLAIMGNVLVLGMTFLMFAMTRIDPGDPLFFLIVLSSILIATPTVNLMVLSRVFKKRQTFHPERRREFGQ